MADFGQNFLKGFIGSGQGLRDYSHASRTFTTNAYELKPRFKFLFHVSFSINTGEIPYLRGVFGSSDVTELSLLVKTADLPRYNIQTQTMNQYNRKRLV
jgi:ABC-type ATPase involved in cell division